MSYRKLRPCNIPDLGGERERTQQPAACLCSAELPCNIPDLGGERVRIQEPAACLCGAELNQDGTTCVFTYEILRYYKCYRVSVVQDTILYLLYAISTIALH